MKPFPVIVIGRGTHKGDYPGAFPIPVERVIEGTIKSPCLHLFSGSSKIGDVRVDLKHKSATVHTDIFKFLKKNKARKQWKYCVLDPPYAIKSANTKLKGYADMTAVSASVPKRQALERFFRAYVENVIWFDQCMPLPKGFYRKCVWLVVPGGYRTPRFINWLRRENQTLDVFRE